MLSPIYLKLRKFTTFLIIVPFIFLFLQFIDSYLTHIFPGFLIFWVAFCVSLHPICVLILVIHYFIGRKRKILKLKINNYDNIKIIISLIGSIIGLILWLIIILMLAS